MRIDFPIPFTKMSGAGNDFILIDHRSLFMAEAEQPEFVRRVCRRSFSVGADGLIFIENSGDGQTDFRWRFYNADGSVAEMCGNGARCAARFAYGKGIAGSRLSFATLAGIIEADIVDEGTVSLKMTPPTDFRTGLQVALNDQERSVYFVNTGVPHVVIFVDENEKEQLPVREWGKIVRFHPLFQPAGTNVNFVEGLGDNTLRVRTYERGVEDETRACGTGAVASAIFGAMGGLAASPVRVLTSGGEQLTVVFDIAFGPEVRNVRLQGPARIIYEGQLTAEALV